MSQTINNNPDSFAGKILVADEDQLTCDAIRSHFESDGYQIDCCTTPKDILSLDLSHYRLIILELSSDSALSFHSIQSIKQSPSTMNIPLIVCSCSSRSQNIVDALNAGADDYLLKPFSVRELMARVRSVLRMSSVQY